MFLESAKVDLDADTSEVESAFAALDSPCKTFSQAPGLPKTVSAPRAATPFLRFQALIHRR
ncbi:hypothetical protein ACWTQZ_25475, partial [Escherichia coli]